MGIYNYILIWVYISCKDFNRIVCGGTVMTKKSEELKESKELEETRALEKLVESYKEKKG